MSPASTPLAVTEIALSKRKLVYWLLFSLVMCGGAAYVFSQADHLVLNGVFNPTLTRLIGGVGFAFFVVVGGLFARKLTDKLPGLVLNAEGFLNNTAGSTPAQVAWREVSGLQEVEMGFSKFLAVQLRDPAAYISQQPNQLTRRILEGNLKTYGSPVLLSASNLECTFDELRALFAQRLAAYQGKR